MKTISKGAEYDSPTVWNIGIDDVSICAVSANDAAIEDVSFIDYGEI